MKRSIVGLLALCPYFVYAQKVAIKEIELVGEKVIVHYDLNDNNPNNQYQISLYASKDKYSAPLTKVTGDVGGEVNPGADRKIEWNLLQEYGTFKGKLSLEIRGRVFVPFVKLREFNAEKRYKRGKNYDINWRPGNTNPIHIELYKGSQRVAGELNHPNNGKTTLSINSKVKPGKDYRLKITDSKKLDEVVYSEQFQIVPKVPLLIKLLPILGVGAAAAVLAPKLGGTEGGGESTTPITDPPFPGN